MKASTAGHAFAACDSTFQAQLCQCLYCGGHAAEVLIGVKCTGCQEQGALALCHAERCYESVLNSGLRHDGCMKSHLGFYPPITFSEPLALPAMSEAELEEQLQRVNANDVKAALLSNLPPLSELSFGDGSIVFTF